jgi:hypothetical protein
MSEQKCTSCNQDAVPDLTKVQSAVHENQAQALQFHPSTLAAKISACVSATYDNGKICVNFPVIGSICFSVSLPIPSGTSVKVCMETCGFKFGFPPFNGIKASVYVGDQNLWTGTIWGSC